MKITKVAVTRKFNLTNYESLDLTAEAELAENENVLEAWNILRDNAEMCFIDMQRKRDAGTAGAQTNSKSTPLQSVQSPPATTIAQLKDSDKKVTITGQIEAVTMPKHAGDHIIMDSTIGDHTGTIKLVLFDKDIDKVKVGDIAKIANGYVSSYKGELQLNVGKYGTLTVEAPK